MRKRYHHADGTAPKRVERYLGRDDVPEDLVNRLAAEYIIRAECAACGHTACYVDQHHTFQVEPCKGPDCDAEIVLD